MLLKNWCATVFSFQIQSVNDKYFFVTYSKIIHTCVLNTQCFCFETLKSPHLPNDAKSRLKNSSVDKDSENDGL